MEANENGTCIAETIDNSITTVPFYIGIAVLCVFIVIVIGTYYVRCRLHCVCEGTGRSDPLHQGRIMMNEGNNSIYYRIYKKSTNV